MGRSFSLLVAVATLVLAAPAEARGRRGWGGGVYFGVGGGWNPGFGMCIGCAPRVVYTPAPVYVAPPQQVYVTAPVVMAPPAYPEPQQQYVPAPPPAPAPQIVYVPVPTPAPAPVPPPPAAHRHEDRRSPDPLEPARFGLKYSGGIYSFERPSWTHSFGLEIRATSWLTFRSDLDLRRDATTWDAVGAKFSIPSRFVSPFASVGVSGTFLSNERLLLGVVGALGIDFKFGKHFFLTTEARLRPGMTPGGVTTCGSCRVEPQFTALAGLGVAFL